VHDLTGSISADLKINKIINEINGKMFFFYLDFGLSNLRTLGLSGLRTIGPSYYRTVTSAKVQQYFNYIMANSLVVEEAGVSGENH
jgi:hypothetical protein